MSIDEPTPHERQLADQVGAILRETEPFCSPGLLESEPVQKKMDDVLHRHRLAVTAGPSRPRDPEVVGYRGLAPDLGPRVPGVDDDRPDEFPLWPYKYIDQLLCPILVPAWNPESAVLMLDGYRIETALKAAGALILDTGLNRSRCGWHDGKCQPGEYISKPYLLTQTRGQYVVVWWTCPACTERLRATFPERPGSPPEISLFPYNSMIDWHAEMEANQARSRSRKKRRR